MKYVFTFVRKAVTGLRAKPRKPKGWLDPEEDSLVPPRDQWIGPDDSISHYFRWIWEYLAYLTTVAELRREEAVLELGCGHGRTSRGLLSYLRSPGSYVGIDVSRDRIADAQNRIARRWPNFTFVWANVRNLQDNPDGVDAAEYVFPFSDASFDLVYAASLFTHLLPSETSSYLKQCARVLRPGGRCLFSFFVLDAYRGPKTTISALYEFDHELPGYRGVAVRDPAYPHAAIAYRRAVIESAARDAGLRVERILPGLWSETPGLAVNEQDLVLLRRE